MQSLLGQFHPQIVHAPIALFIFALVFEVVGVSLDSPWWRKAATAMLAIGILCAGVAVLSGEGASGFAEHRQGVPVDLLEAHGQTTKTALWLAIGALIARIVAGVSWLGGSRQVVGAVAFLLHVAAAATIAVGAHRGAQLVYQHGAGVSLEGKLIRHPSKRSPESPTAVEPPADASRSPSR